MALFKAARAAALLEARDYVVPDDVKLLFLLATEDVVRLSYPGAIHRTWLRTQAAALQQTAAATCQLSGTVSQNAEHAVQAHRLAQAASDVAVRSRCACQSAASSARSWRAPRPRRCRRP